MMHPLNKYVKHDVLQIAIHQIKLQLLLAIGNHLMGICNHIIEFQLSNFSNKRYNYMFETQVIL